MSPVAVRKNPNSGLPYPFTAGHSARHAGSQLKRSPRPGPRTAEEKIPPQSLTRDIGLAANDALNTQSPRPVSLDPSQIKTVSVKEAAFRLHKSSDSIYSWLRRGRLRGWQPGGPGCQIMVIESSVELAMKNLLGCSTPSAGIA